MYSRLVPLFYWYINVFIYLIKSKWKKESYFTAGSELSLCPPAACWYCWYCWYCWFGNFWQHNFSGDPAPENYILNVLLCIIHHIGKFIMLRHMSNTLLVFLLDTLFKVLWVFMFDNGVKKLEIAQIFVNFVWYYQQEVETMRLNKTGLLDLKYMMSWWPFTFDSEI